MFFISLANIIKLDEDLEQNIAKEEKSPTENNNSSYSQVKDIGCIKIISNYLNLIFFSKSLQKKKIGP